MSARADMVLRIKDWIETVIEFVKRGGVSKTESRMPGNRRKIKALVIDDDPICRQRVRMILQDFCDCAFAPTDKAALNCFGRPSREINRFSW